MRLGATHAHRCLAVVALLVSALILSGLFAVSSRAETAAAVDPTLAGGIAAEINAVRASYGLSELSRSTKLTRAARAHGVSMGTQGYFSHSSADGSSPVRRIASFYPVNGRASWSVGEVLVWVTGSLTPSQAVSMWLASPSHRADMLLPRWREIGVAAVHVTDAPGVYVGRNVTIVVVDFARIA